MKLLGIFVFLQLNKIEALKLLHKLFRIEKTYVIYLLEIILIANNSEGNDSEF